MISKENTKIFFVNKFNWLDPSPMATISIHFTNALAELGFETTLIMGGKPATDVNSYLQEKFDLKPLKNYKIELFSRLNFFFIKTSTTYYLKAVKHILENLQSKPKVIVISRNTNFLPYFYILSKFSKIKTVFEAHGYHGVATLPGLPQKTKDSVKLSRQFRIIERAFLNKLDGLVCITSPQQKLYLKDFVKIPTVFLPLASHNYLTDDVIESLPDLFKHKKLCYAGRLTPHINPQILFEALNMLRDQSITFVWIGLKPEDFPVLEGEVKKYQLENRVELKGWLSHSEMSHYIRNQVSIGFVGYKSTFRSAAVTSPSKILDYFAGALPVIAPRLPNVEDIIESSQKYSWQNRAKKFIEFVINL